MKKFFISFFIVIVGMLGISSFCMANEGYGEVYRLYNTQTLEHLYTPDINEYNTLQSLGWRGEGVAWIANYGGPYYNPVYRLYSSVTHEHIYTKDESEIATLTHNGWSIDNTGSPIFDGVGSIIIYRLYNLTANRHHLTADVDEYRTLGSLGWRQEGAAFSGFDLGE